MNVPAVIAQAGSSLPQLVDHAAAALSNARSAAEVLEAKDNSPEAQNARRISGFADLDGLEFVARIDIGKDSNGEDKNDIRQAVTRDHKDYAAAMGSVASPMAFGAAPSPAYAAPQGYLAPPPQPAYAQAQPPQPAYAAPQPAAPAPVAGVRPTWAK